MDREITNPRTTPIVPPAKEIIVASTTNWRTMSERRAPTARRKPISRVRSRMLASMMFMMPMPPTSSEIDAMATITVLNNRSVRLCSASNSAGTMMLKSSAPWCDESRTALTTCAASGMAEASPSWR